MIPNEYELQPDVEQLSTPSFEIKPYLAGDLVLLTGTTNPKLAHDIAANLGMTLDEPCTTFGDGEIDVQIHDNLRGRHVVIAHSTAPRPNDAWMELYLMADAALRGSAESISAIIPYYSYSRQDRKNKARKPISAALVANLAQKAGIDRYLMTLDLHADQSTSTVQLAWDNLPASHIYIPEIERWNLDDACIVSPDVGRLKANEKIAKQMELPLASIYKTRDQNGHDEIEVLGVMGHVKNRDCVLVDDLTSSGKTLTQGAQLLLEQHGARSVRAIVTHLVSAKAIENICTPPDGWDTCPIEKFIVTDTIAQEIPPQYADRIQVVSVAPMLAEAILCNQTGESLSKRFYSY